MTSFQSNSAPSAYRVMATVKGNEVHMGLVVRKPDGWQFLSIGAAGIPSRRPWSTPNDAVRACLDQIPFRLESRS